MAVFIDQTGRPVAVDAFPQRIVSLVPSQTELLYELGLDEQVVGITKFCVHPETWWRSKQRVGGTKNLKLEVIEALKPDLIIANKEENEKDQVEQLAKFFPVWISDISNIAHALEMIDQLGVITGRILESSLLQEKIKSKFAHLTSIPGSNLRAAYLIWRNPYMTVGGDTFIHAMLLAAGFQNIFESERRYPQTDPATLRAMHCELLLLSSEPFPFNVDHQRELANLLPDTQILLVDGEMFSWYGSRLLAAVDYLQMLRSRLY
jgi:ABC-type Fe3+-hydroxamate transport system substrate-binding protein